MKTKEMKAVVDYTYPMEKCSSLLMYRQRNASYTKVVEDHLNFEWGNVSPESLKKMLDNNARETILFNAETLFCQNVLKYMQEEKRILAEALDVDSIITKQIEGVDKITSVKMFRDEVQIETKKEPLLHLFKRLYKKRN